MAAAPGDPTAGRTRAPQARTVLAALALLALPFAIYAPALHGPFFSDDLRFIEHNVANLERLATPSVFFDPATSATPPDRDIYRPLRTWSYAVDLRLFGLSPAAFRVHGLLLHGLATLLLWRLLRGTLARFATRPGGSPAAAGSFAAGFGAVWFAVHPIAAEAVAWISSRADLQAAVLVLAALLVARATEAAAPRTRTLLLAAALALAAGLAKETATVVPALFLVEHCVRRGAFSRAALAPCLALAAGAAVYLAIYVVAKDGPPRGQVDWYTGSLFGHLPYTLLGAARALRLLVAPADYHFFYEPWLFASVGAAALAGAGAVVLGAAAVGLALRRRLPALAGGLAFFAIAFLPAANLLFPLRTLLAERFLYLPLAGAALAVGGLAAALARHLRSRTALAALLAVVLAPFAALAVQRARDFGDLHRLYARVQASWPRSHAAALGAASLAESEGDLEAAAAGYSRALELAAGDPLLAMQDRYAAGHVLLLAGRPRESVEALGPVDAALREDPDLVRRFRHAAAARYDLGCALVQILEYGLAAEVFERLIAVHGETAERLDALAEVERARGRERARDLYLRALELDPDHHPARLHLAEAYLASRETLPIARKLVLEVLARDPGHARAQALLARIDAAGR